MTEQQDNNSAIYKEFLERATRACSKLRELSDRGQVVCPVHIGEVQDAIIKELGEVYFLGLKVEQ